MKSSEIKQLIDENKVILFMKGSKLFPQCGFSAKVVGMLAELNVDYKDVNVLLDEELRSEIKTFSNWPTIPQLYINGEFIGGCDIVTELFHNGKLKDMVSN